MPIMDVIENPAVVAKIRSLAKNAGNISKALENAESVQNLVADPETGNLEKIRAASSAARTALTSGTAERAMDAILDRPEGQMVLNIMNNPAIKGRIINNPLANIPLAALNDRKTAREFMTAQSEAAGRASGLYSEIAAGKARDEVNASGTGLAESALRELSTFGPVTDINSSELIRIAELKAGRTLSAPERRTIRDTAEEIRKKAYASPGLHAVYSGRPGGLSAARSLTALRTAAGIASSGKERLQASTTAETEAGGLLERIMNTPAPEREDLGPRINLKKLMDAGRSKQAAWDAGAFFAKIAESSSDSVSILDVLSGETSRKKNKVLIQDKRNFDEDNGVDSYIRTNYLSSWQEFRNPSASLRDMLKKAKMEMLKEASDVEVYPR